MIRCVSAVATLFACTFIHAETLRLVANFWEPFTGKGLEHDGCAAELVTTALKRAGYDASVTIEPWARALRYTYSGRFDGIVAIWRTRERLALIDFSQAYYENRIVVLKRRDRELQINSLKDLTGLTVGTGIDYGYNDELSDATNFKREAVTFTVQNLEKLMSSRVDVAIEDDVIAKYHMAKDEADRHYGRDLELLLPPLFTLPLHFGMSGQFPRHREVIEQFDAALAAMRADGSYAEILRRHNC